MSLQQINSAITAKNKFFSKATDGQYSLVELEQAKLGSDLSNCTWICCLSKQKYTSYNGFSGSNQWWYLIQDYLAI